MSVELCRVRRNSIVKCESLTKIPFSLSWLTISVVVVPDLKYLLLRKGLSDCVNLFLAGHVMRETKSL